MYGKGLRTLSVASVAAFAASLTLVFFYAPLEAEQGVLQKIFYGVFGALHLRTRESRWDMRSYVVIHTSLIFAVGTLVTGSIWAKGSWGHWWVWSEPTLVSFLIVFLLYVTYQPLRFAIEDPERQARYASVFAVTAGAFVPMNFIAVRLSTAYLHPRVLGSTSNLPGPMALTFLVSLLAVVLLFATLCSYELAAKRTRAQVRALRRALVGEDLSRATRSPVPRSPAGGGVAASLIRGGARG